MSSTTAGPRDASGSPTCERRTPLPAITSSRAIGQLLRTGRRMRDRHVTLVYTAAGTPGARLALVVPRRSGNAVKRNRIRRILKEEARLAQHVRAMPYDMALCWKGPITDEAAQHARREAALLLRKFADGSQCSPKPPSQ